MAEAEHRVLDAPMMSFALDEEIAKLKQGHQWKIESRAAVTLVKNDALTIVLVVLHKGATLKEHHEKGPVTVTVLEGSIRFRASSDERMLARGALLTLTNPLPHDVEALEESAFVLTVIQPR